MFADKVVVITGGSAGLGRDLAMALARAGARVAIVARDQPRLEETALQLRAVGGEVLPITADITRDEDAAQAIAQVVARFGRLDMLINNAGRSARGKLLDAPLEEYRSLWELNFLATVRMTKLAMPHLLLTKGHVVNIASLAAKAASRYSGAYAASKFPVAAFSQQLRLELVDQGVHVLLVCPGPIARDDAGERYAKQAVDLPESAQRPGGGVKLKGLDPEVLVRRILLACERREAELVMPWKARILFAISQLSASWGDWLIRKNT